MQLTFTEENYLKAIYSGQHGNEKGEVSVNEISERMQTKPATVTDMLRKLSEKELIHYEKYKKVRLSEKGTVNALQIVRKHRLWEAFLHDKLFFSWDEVHEVAEQLEHIHSAKLIERLDEYLGYPQFDPHGDPIPNEEGQLPASSALRLTDTAVSARYTIVAVKDTSTAFLQQLERMKLNMGTILTVKERLPFDNSILVTVNNDTPVFLSEKTAANLLVNKLTS